MLPIKARLGSFPMSGPRSSGSKSLGYGDVPFFAEVGSDEAAAVEKQRPAEIRGFHFDNMLRMVRMAWWIGN